MIAMPVDEVGPKVAPASTEGAKPFILPWLLPVITIGQDIENETACNNTQQN